MDLEIMLVFLAIAFTQQTHPQSQPLGSGAVVSSAPGKVAIALVVKRTGTIVAINKATRTITIKGSEGRMVDVIAGDEVKNFEQLRTGDEVAAAYAEALTLELKKSRARLNVTTSNNAVRAAPGQRPMGGVGREVHVLADVVAVDPSKSTISLKSPQGNIVDLKVQNPEHYKVVKVGDQIEAVYMQALAVAVTPSAKQKKIAVAEVRTGFQR